MDDEPGSQPEDEPEQQTFNLLRSPLNISIEKTSDAIAAPQLDQLHAHLSALCTHLQLKTGQYTVILIHDERMSAMHEQFSGIPGTTDVLTFDMKDEFIAEEDHIDGEVYICIDEAQRQADAREHELYHEILLYALHGILHLLGYDDHNEQDHAIMHAKEDELLNAIGIGPIFYTEKNTTSDSNPQKDCAISSEGHK